MLIPILFIIVISRPFLLSCILLYYTYTGRCTRLAVATIDIQNVGEPRRVIFDYKVLTALPTVFGAREGPFKKSRARVCLIKMP